MFIAFHDPAFPPEALLSQLRAHAAADEIIQGKYWDEGKGCAVGCTIHGDEHEEYERRGYCTAHMAHLEDCIFEGLSNSAAKAWPLRFTEALASVQGHDVSRVHWRFLIWLLTDEEVNPSINHPLVRDAVRQCAEVMRIAAETGAVDMATAARAERAAERAERAAERDERALWRAAWSARSAAWSVRSVAYAAVRAIRSVTCSARADSRIYPAMADKLIEIIEATPCSPQ